MLLQHVQIYNHYRAYEIKLPDFFLTASVAVAVALLRKYWLKTYKSGAPCRLFQHRPLKVVHFAGILLFFAAHKFVAQLMELLRVVGMGEVSQFVANDVAHKVFGQEQQGIGEAYLFSGNIARA